MFHVSNSWAQIGHGTISTSSPTSLSAHGLTTPLATPIAVPLGGGVLAVLLAAESDAASIDMDVPFGGIVSLHSSSLTTIVNTLACVPACAVWCCPALVEGMLRAGGGVDAPLTGNDLDCVVLVACGVSLSVPLCPLRATTVAVFVDVDSDFDGVFADLLFLSLSTHWKK